MYMYIWEQAISCRYNHAVTYLYKVIFTDVGKYVKDRDVLAFTARGTTATSF